MCATPYIFCVELLRALPVGLVTSTLYKYELLMRYKTATELQGYEYRLERTEEEGGRRKYEL